MHIHAHRLKLATAFGAQMRWREMFHIDDDAIGPGISGSTNFGIIY